MHNKRYIPVGGEAQFERFAVSIKFVTVERNAISNAARNIPPPLALILKDTNMFGDLKILYDLLIDKSKSIGHRFAAFISIIGILLIADYISNFTYNIYISNKLENLESINNLKNIYKNDSIHYSELLTIENRVLSSTHYLDFVRFHWSKIDFKSKKVDQQNHQTISDTKTNINPIRSLFWMVLSSNYSSIIVLVFFIFLPFYSKEKDRKTMIVGWFALLIISSIVISIITWLAYLIPIINGNPLWNYILNSLIHTIFILIVIYISKRNKN